MSKALILLAATSIIGFTMQQATAAIDLGTAKTYAVLAGTEVTNTGATTIKGDVGLHPGTSITGAETVTQINGVVHATDDVSLQAKNDLTAAYLVAAGLPKTQTLTGQDLGGLKLFPGVYFFAADAVLTGTLTLDAKGDPNAEFVFQITRALDTASGSVVNTINAGATPGSKVFWLVGSSAVLETTTAFQGNILAYASVSLKTGATIQNGGAMAQTAAVTLEGNTITQSVVPEPATMGLALVSGAMLLMRRSRRDVC